MEFMKEHLQQKGLDWEHAEKPIEIIGVFDSQPVIVKADYDGDSGGAKFLSPEEEALQRKFELADLKQSRKEVCMTYLKPSQCICFYLLRLIT
jgi:hypothetical protein